MSDHLSLIRAGKKGTGKFSGVDLSGGVGLSDDRKLDTPITNCSNWNATMKPILAANPTYAYLLESTNPRGQGNVILTITKEKLLTILAVAKDKAPKADNEPNVGTRTLADLCATTIAQFNALSTAQQNTFINAMWNRVVLSKVPDTLGEAMSEGQGQVTEGKEPLPTSLMPVGAATNPVKLSRRVSRAWADYTVGFRVDGKRESGGKDEFEDRVKPRGCQPLAHNRAAMRSVRGYVVDDTVVEDKARVFLWAGNRDVFNETGTCVSRSLFGATAFPERTTDSEKDGIIYHHMLALDCRGLTGVDTEAWQLSLGVTSNWRPGEKVFTGVPPERILAWTQLLRKPGSAKSGWSFCFPTTDWTWLKKPDSLREAYINGELKAWKAGEWYDTHGEYDFA